MLTLNSSLCQVLIFGHQSSHRDQVALLESLAGFLLLHHVSIQHVIFTTAPYPRSASTGDNAGSGSDSQFSLLDQYVKPWERAYPSSKVGKVRSIESALELARKIGGQGNATQVLITGSLHVVGEALRILG